MPRSTLDLFFVFPRLGEMNFISENKISSYPIICRFRGASDISLAQCFHWSLCVFLQRKPESEYSWQASRGDRDVASSVILLLGFFFLPPKQVSSVYKILVRLLLC